MPQVRRLLEGPVAVTAYRCDAGPRSPAYWEHHDGWSVSYVQRGSFSCCCQGRMHELVPGSVLVLKPGDDYQCTHAHREGGDDCLAVLLAPEVVHELAPRRGAWLSGGLPPLAELMVRGELMRAVACGHSDVGLDEAALAFVARFAQWWMTTRARVCRHAPSTGAVRCNQRCGSTRTPIASSACASWRRSADSVRTTTCGCSHTRSASRRISTWCAAGCARRRGA